MRNFPFFIAAMMLAAPAAGQQAVLDEWRDRPSTVTEEEAGRDPDGAAQRAIAAGDWRPFSSLTFGSHGIDGLDCAMPLAMFMFATVVRQLPHTPSLPGEARPVRANLVPYNRALLAAPASPLAGICNAAASGEDIRPTLHAEPRRPWGMIVPPPAQRARNLLEAARWGRAAEAASLPVDPALPKDVFHMNALAWAVVHGDIALVRRIMASRPDNAAWCASGVLYSGFERRAAGLSDPLNLAAEAGRADLAALIAPVFSQAACASPHSYHALYQDALRTALAGRDEVVVRLLIAHYGPVDRSHQGDLARRIEEAGLGWVAADFYYAAPEIDYNHPLNRTSGNCEYRAAAFWAAESLRRGRRADLAYAWERFQNGELTLGNGARPDAERFDCAAVLDLYRGHGFRLAPDSPLLHWAVYGDRNALSGKATRAEAERFLAAWRRLGGRFDILARVHCPRGPGDSALTTCTVGALARGVPSNSRAGETVFAELLPPDPADAREGAPRP